MPPPGGLHPVPNSSANPFSFDSYNEVHPNVFGGPGLRPPDFLSSSFFGGERNDSPIGEGGLFGSVSRQQVIRARPASRLAQPAEPQSIFGAAPHRSYRPDVQEPYMPSFASFGSRPPAEPFGRDNRNAQGRGLFGQSALSSIMNASSAIP